jgi:protein SCO1/2
VFRNVFFIIASLVSANIGFPNIGEVHAAEIPDALKDIGITEHLGSNVSIQNLVFKDETGKEVHLGDYFKSGRPVILNMTYFECPNLCTFVLNGLVTSLKEIEWSPGKQFEVVTVSINPRETPALASLKKKAYLGSYDRAGAENGWHFLTGDDDQIHKLADQVGFRYRYDESQKQYAHSAALFVLTPEGKISRYLYGIEFKPQDMRLALLEATNGKIGNVVDRILLFCYRYDAQTKKYSVYLGKVMQAGGAGTILVFGGYLAVFWRSERKRSHRNSRSASEKKGV